MIMKLAGARGRASRAGRYSPEQSLTVDCFPSSEPVSARAAMVPSADTIIGVSRPKAGTLDQPEPDALKWRAPSGRAYATSPTRYPI
jgi:hypothetical protein